MKILVVINSLSPRGGAERVVSTLTREWSRKHDVVIVVFDGRFTSYECGGDIIDLRLPAVGSFFRRAHRAIWERSMHLALLLRREQPNLIVSLMETANLTAIAAATITGHIGRLRVSVRTNPSAIPTPWRWFIPLLYRVPGRVIAPSSGVKTRLERMGIPTSKMLVIPNPVAADAVATADVLPPFPHPYVLGVGRLHREKGFDKLVTAFADVEQEDHHLVVLGDGRDRRRLVCLTGTLGVASRVHFPGAVSDLRPWYRHARCFVLSSRHEGFPNVLIEAMANGCPVISFDCRYGPREIVKDGESGLLVAQDDISKLSFAISRVVSDSALRSRLGAAARRDVERYNVENIAARWYADMGG